MDVKLFTINDNFINKKSLDVYKFKFYRGRFITLNKTDVIGSETFALDLFYEEFAKYNIWWFLYAFTVKAFFRRKQL